MSEDVRTLRLAALLERAGLAAAQAGAAGHEREIAVLSGAVTPAQAAALAPAIRALGFRYVTVSLEVVPDA